MKALKPVLLILAVAGLSVAREAPTPEVDSARSPEAGVASEVSPAQWLEILSPVLVSTRPEDQQP
jgi:hypothetical protein